MEQPPRFNYIITIHNKESMIEQVITSVLMCCRDDSHVYPVIDGCTDGSEQVIDDLIKKYANIPITKVVTPDVHELRSINAGLKAANHDGDGYNIILQDDVVLADFKLEEKVNNLYRLKGPKLGYVSFRLGANLNDDAAVTDERMPIGDLVENAYGHAIENSDLLLPGDLAYRTVMIKSPVCIPFYLLRDVGLMDERLTVYDDIEYSVRCVNAGYANAVFPIKFYSLLEWGRASRHYVNVDWNGPKKGFKLLARDVQQKNMEKIQDWHGEAMSIIIEKGQSKEIEEIKDWSNDEDRKRAKAYWDKTNRKILEAKAEERVGLYAKIISLPKRILRKIIRELFAICERIGLLN